MGSEMPVKKSLTCLALALFLAALLGAAGCNTVVTGSGENATWKMDYSDFNSIEVSSAFDITIERSDSYLVQITIDKTLYEYLKIDQRGDTLRIGLKSGYTYIGTKQEAVVNLPDLHQLKLSDASKAVVSGFSMSHSLDFSLSDASRLELQHIIAGNCGFSLYDASQVSGSIEMDDGSFNLSDASSLALQGSAGNIDIRASSSSDLELSDFAVVTAAVDLASSSHAVINVSTRMDVNLSASSDLEYIGSPKLGKLSMSGGSTLNQKQ